MIDFAFNPFVIYYFSRLTVRTDLFGRKRAARPAAQLPPGEGAASEGMEVPL